MITPQYVYQLLDLTPQKMLLGSKKSAPTAWRKMSNLLNGKTDPTKEVLIEFSRIAAKRFGQSGESGPDFRKIITIEANYGNIWDKLCEVMAEGGTQWPVFFLEARRTERLFNEIGTLLRENQIIEAQHRIQGFDAFSVSNVSTFLPKLHPEMTATQLHEPISVWQIITILYLLACWDVDFFHGRTSSYVAHFLPLRDGEKIIAPMTRWMVQIKKALNCMTWKELSKRLLGDNMNDEGREARGWKAGTHIPSWARIPQIIRNIGEVPNVTADDLAFYTYCDLAIVRFLHNLLKNMKTALSSHAEGQSQAFWLDPLTPFDAYQDLYSLAQNKMVAGQTPATSH